MLDGEHMRRFVADQRRRERDGLPSLAIKQPGGKASIVTTVTRSIVFNALHKMLRDAMDTGAADRIGLAREFIVAVPTAGATTGRTPRRPFPDEVARALADENNLRRLAEVYDPHDRGLRDMWEITVTTGRRIGEVLQVPLGLPGPLRRAADVLARPDQGRQLRRRDPHPRTAARRHRRAATQDPGSLHRPARSPARRRRTRRAGAVPDHPPQPRRQRRAEPTSGSTAGSASGSPNSTSATACRIRPATPWPPTCCAPAPASPTSARYLGQVSDRMAEHYVHLSNSDLEDVLQQVWVAGPGTANPGELLTSDASPMTREQAQALAIDLSRRSTPAEGGFCTFQPVVDGGACPWNLDCHNCDKFVLSGADLLYWRRKREQWRQLAEGAPDDATADYLHRYFEPTARAIDGLEKSTGRPRAARPGPRPGPAQTPGLLPPGLVDRLPRHRPHRHRHHGARRTTANDTDDEQEACA